MALVVELIVALLVEGVVEVEEAGVVEDIDRVLVDVLEDDEVVGVVFVVVGVELLVVVREVVVIAVNEEEDVEVVDDRLEEVEELELGATTIPYAAAPATATMMITATTNTKRVIAFLLCITHGIRDCLLK